jgi:predicted Zn-dependent protease
VPRTRHSAGFLLAGTVFCSIQLVAQGTTGKIDAPAAPPLASIARPIWPIILRQDAESAGQRYHELKRRSPDRYDLSEPELNRLGYHLLKLGRARDAVQILTLNVESYPESSNVYDSLGEAWLAGGDTAPAVANYRRSLELDASHHNAAQLLKRLGTP